MNCNKSCFEKIFALRYLNLIVPGKEPGVRARLTKSFTGVCDVGRQCHGVQAGSGSEERCGGAGNQGQGIITYMGSRELLGV